MLLSVKTQVKLQFVACLACLSLLALSCAQSPAPAMDASVMGVDDGGFTPIVFELGTGLTEWQSVPLADGHMKLIMGPQGGYHVLGRLRFSSFSSDVSVQFKLASLDGTTLYNNPSDVLRRRDRQGLFQTATGWESSSAELVIFTAIRNPSEVAGKIIRWEVTLQDNMTGLRAYAQRVVTVDWP
jgi:hypothetical protein